MEKIKDKTTNNPFITGLIGFMVVSGVTLYVKDSTNKELYYSWTQFLECTKNGDLVGSLRELYYIWYNGFVGQEGKSENLKIADGNPDLATFDLSEKELATMENVIYLDPHRKNHKVQFYVKTGAPFKGVLGYINYYAKKVLKGFKAPISLATGIATLLLAFNQAQIYATDINKI